MHNGILDSARNIEGETNTFSITIGLDQESSFKGLY